tara:strand:- start:63 stop:278 length:216 start_codon:yes stop_codon:yes gene_type:complete
MIVYAGWRRRVGRYIMVAAAAAVTAAVMAVVVEAVFLPSGGGGGGGDAEIDPSLSFLVVCTPAHVHVCFSL